MLLLPLLVPSLRAPPPTAMAQHPAARVRVAERSDLTQLAELTTSALFGDVDLLKSGPVAMLQRKQKVQEQRRTIERRLALEDECEARFLVAVEQTKYGDRVCGCIDAAVHLFDVEAMRFQLEASEMTDEDMERGCRWAPYLASVAVSKPDRRRGVARQLVGACEAWAATAGYEEVMLEVSQLNTPAIEFYRRGGYEIMSSFAEGEAGGGAEEVVQVGLRWEVRQVAKHVMRKALPQ